MNKLCPQGSQIDMPKGCDGSNPSNNNEFIASAGLFANSDVYITCPATGSQIQVVGINAEGQLITLDML